MIHNIQTIVFGGGCFWCVEAVFSRVDGVRDVVVGYAGGASKDPTYESVSSGGSGHAEVAQIQYDESLITLASLLELFFKMHDPTSLNSQGADVGTQYRSAIYWNTEEQESMIKAFISNKQRKYTEKIVTQVQQISVFYRAEEYHQHYFENNPEQAYCQSVIAPKLAKIKNDI